MRISDWSSDVCSSDLAGGIQEASDAVGRLCANGDPVLGALDVQNNALLIILGEQRIVAADTLDETAIAGRTAVGDDDLVIGTLRSEEHTSELQSLMRISYAVFCLKKKTTNQSYKQNEQVSSYIKPYRTY